MTAYQRTPARRGTAAGIVAAGALLLAACGSDDKKDDSMPDMGHGGSHSAPRKPAGGVNDADVAFAQAMIPHHEQALDMARLAAGRASDQEVKDLARTIERAQDPEIKTMTGWLKSWGEPTAMPSMEGMDHSSMDGMMSAEDMKGLKGKSGTAFDKAFARMMIGHHNGAIKMAKNERAEGGSPAAKKLAGAIVKGQSAEVGQLKKILDRL